jgi:hypothetical protein
MGSDDARSHHDTSTAAIKSMRMLTPLDHLQPTHDLSRFGARDLQEWDLILQTRSNALLQGSSLALQEAVSALEPYLDSPHYTASGPRWSLPSTAKGTLFLDHVAECSTEQQHELMDWLDSAARRVLVITTTERPLFDQVKCGAFLSSLYYRLNTIHLILPPP